MISYLYLSSSYNNIRFKDIDFEDLKGCEFYNRNDKLFACVDGDKIELEFFKTEKDNLDELLGDDQEVRIIQLNTEEYNYLKLRSL